MDTAILEQIGLSKNEIKVYFALVELEQSTTTAIIKKADIPTSKIYPVLDKLIKKGLVSYVTIKKKKHFQASNPSNLINLMNEKQKQIDQQKNEIKKLIPKIKKKTTEKQEAKVYEGIEGFKTAFNNLLSQMNKGESYYVFTLGEELLTKKMIRFFHEYHLKRAEKKVKVQLLIPEKIKKQYQKRYTDKRFKPETGAETRYTKTKLPNGVVIYKNTVMTMVKGEELTAFVITSKSNYEHYKEFFEEMWKKALK